MSCTKTITLLLRFLELLEAFLKYKNAVFNGEQEKEYIFHVRMG